MDRCVQCGHEGLGSTAEEVKRKVAGREFKATIPAQRCPECNERCYEVDDLARFDLSVAGKLAREGPVTGEALRFMRKAVGLTGAELAELLGVTPESVSRWEHDKLAFDRRTFALVGLMALDRIEGRSTVTDVLRGLDERSAA